MITTTHPTSVTTVEDVEELDALALDRTVPLDRVLLIDRFGSALTAYPDRFSERVTIVRHPRLGEAVRIVDGAGSEETEMWEPLAYPSEELGQWRFPMTVAHVDKTAIIPTDLETDLAA